ncbi:MAG: tyrosine-type recombinase/integrase [Oscillospiraceae bacterium]|nr:tyrosine-type recombinase/integrase [Oscillospiraceae bacterium]
MSNPDFAEYIYSYFMKYLPLQRGLSQNTISSYSCSLMLFFQYCKSEASISYEKLVLNRIDKHLIENFLLWLETERNNCAASRNQRLSALKSLFLYIQSESIIYTALCRDILSIPEKKTPLLPPKYLSVDEMEALFSIPDIKTKHGRRDIVLLLLLYDSAARVSELINLKAGDAFFGKTPTVKLFGKGSKTRIVPIASKTADMLYGYMKENKINKLDQFLFENHSHNKLTTAGVSYILKKYVEIGKQLYPEMFLLTATPHLLRSTKASHLIQGGANIYYIRDFLGHSSVVTTERYARNNPEVVRSAISKASSDLIGDSEYYNENEKSTMLDFLKSL